MKTWNRRAWLLPFALLACESEPTTLSTEWSLCEPTFEVGGLGDDERYILGEVVGGVRLDDGRVVVADHLAHGLKMYSPEGEFLTQVGGEGEGPGEFEYLRAMGRCAEGRIVAFQINWGQNVYDRDLEFVGTRPAEIGALGGSAYELACNEAGYVLATGWSRSQNQFTEGYYVATAPVVLLRDGELVHDFGERLSSERVGILRDGLVTDVAGNPAGCCSPSSTSSTWPRCGSTGWTGDHPARPRPLTVTKGTLRSLPGSMGAAA